MPADTASYLADSLRMMLGGVFLIALIAKLSFPRSFYRDVAAYGLIPEPIVPAATGLLIAVEAFLSVCLIGGWALDYALPIATATFSAFACAVSVNLMRKNRIRCGCFGSGSEFISISSVIRLVLLGVAAGLLSGLRSGSVVRMQSLPSLGAAHAGGGTYLVAASVTAAAFLILGRWLLSGPALIALAREAFAVPRHSARGAEGVK